MQKTLAEVVAEKPFDDFHDWWDMGPEFIAFMSKSIFGQWIGLPGNSGDMADVRDFYATYLDTAYRRTPEAAVVSSFCEGRFPRPVRSGEFDALSYAFFRSAFEIIAAHAELYEHPQQRERRLFTKQVGATFFNQVDQHLLLDVPSGLESQDDLDRMVKAIELTGAFLMQQGYLRTHFAFSFDVDVEYEGRQIRQRRVDLIPNLKQNGVAYALYEMGYPVILPSAVYLYHTIGEAQHHSSRTIEEIFSRAGYQARETDDFDPIGYPSDRVIELWEIRKA